MFDDNDAPATAVRPGWPTEPAEQILLALSALAALVFVVAGGYLPFILIGLAMPWLTAAYVARRRDEAQLFGPSAGGRSIAGIGGMLLYPAMAFRALFDTDFDDTIVSIALPCLLLGGVCLGVWLWADPVARTRPLMASALALQALAWGAGASVFVNVRFDGSTPDVVQARVVDRYRSRVRRSAIPVYSVTLERFGTVTVPEEVYGTVPAGSLACVLRHGGRLGVTWLSVERCPRPPRAPRTPAAQ